MRNILVLAAVLLFLSTQAIAQKLFTADSLFEIKFPRNPVVEAETGPLNYYGGVVLSNVKVFVGIWNERVSEEVKSNMVDFYSTYVTSPHMDWLNEYKTVGIFSVDGRMGSQQEIGRGELIGQKIMTPSVSDKKIHDTQIQQEIVKQIDAGHFPRPDKNTLYMMHFPPDIKITVVNMTSCFYFGAYHWAFYNEKYGDIYYAVIPDCTPYGNGGFDRMTFASAHELVSAVTDPSPTPGFSPAYPQAWNTDDGTEISDLCLYETTLISTKRRYNISQQWSNSRNACYDGQ